jgi:MSHA pilin protein MshC
MNAEIKTVMKEQGFTLIELIMVLIIVGVLSVVAVSKFNPASFDSAAAAGELVSAIRYAQERSMSNTGGTNYNIVITTSGYTVKQGASNITHPVTGAASYSNDSGGVWANASISPALTITFDGDGAPDLAANQTFTLTVGSESTSVTVEKETGFAR